MILQSTAKGGRVVPRPKSQIISALFSTTYDFAVLKMGPMGMHPGSMVIARLFDGLLTETYDITAA